MPLRGGGRNFTGQDGEMIRRTEMERRRDKQELLQDKKARRGYGEPVSFDYTASVFERVYYDPSNGTLTIKAPAVPQRRERFSVKNPTTSNTVVTIDGNGKNIENPCGPGATVASFSLGGAHISIDWEYSGTEWVII